MYIEINRYTLEDYIRNNKSSIIKIDNLEASKVESFVNSITEKWKSENKFIRFGDSETMHQDNSTYESKVSRCTTFPFELESLEVLLSAFIPVNKNKDEIVIDAIALMSKFEISKTNDEWYYVYLKTDGYKLNRRNEEPFLSDFLYHNGKYYKCDQIDGLFALLTDMSWNKKSILPE